MIHLLIHFSESSALFSPIRVGRPVQTMNLCVRDAPPRTLWKTPRLAYVRPCNLSTSLRPTIVTRTSRPPKLSGRKKHNMHFSDFDIECFPGALSPAFVLNLVRPTWSSGLACSTHYCEDIVGARIEPGVCARKPPSRLASQHPSLSVHRVHITDALDLVDARDGHVPRLPSMPMCSPWTSAYPVTPPREISFVQLVATPVLAERCEHSCCLCGIGRLPLAQTTSLKDAQGESQCALQSQAASCP